MTTQIITLDLRRAGSRTFGQSLAKAFASALQALVLLVGGISILVLGIAMLLDTAVRALERFAS